MSDYLKRLASALKKREAPMGPNAWDWQTRADNAPVGSVNAPGGFMRPIPEDKPADNFGRFLGAAGMMPGPTGDLLGPLADAYMYASDPESRTAGNFAMSALGALPFIPSLATVFHGSPHKFDAFDLSKIGTGEGAQAYGHGLYFAEAPDVARNYSADRSGVGRYIATGAIDNSGPQKIAQDAIDRIGDPNKAADELRLALQMNSKSKNPAQLTANKEVEEAINLISSGAVARKGSLYTVDLPDEAIAKMLDWDKPLSEQVPEVQAAVEGIMAKRAAESEAQRQLLNSQNPGRLTHPVLSRLASVTKPKTALDYKGQAAVEELVKELGGPEKASEYLRAQGIPGIRYLDGGSRGAGQGTSNYVVFDDKLPKILKRE